MVESFPVRGELGRKVAVVQRSLPVDLAVIESPKLIHWIVHLLEGVRLIGTGATDGFLDLTDQILVGLSGGVLVAAFDSQFGPGETCKSPGNVALEIGSKTQSGAHTSMSV